MKLSDIQLPDFLDIKIFEITLLHWLIFLVFIIFLQIIVFFFFKKGATKLQELSRKTKNDFDDLVTDFIASSLRWPITFLVISLGAYLMLPLAPFGKEIFEKFTFLLVLGVTLLFSHKIIDYASHRMGDKVGIGGGKGLPVFSRLIKIGVWVLAVLLVLSNFGFNITSLIAGLGIGGIAIALAVQNVLGDIFASISISVDQPFKIGDYIKAGNVSGTVENIGIKTTRIRTLNGEEVSVPNASLTSAEIHNYARMFKRRAIISVGVTYDTSQEKLKKIPEILKNIAEGLENTKFIRAHFISFGDFSLNFELVFDSLSSTYDDLLKIKEKALYDIFEKCNDEGIEMAFPTQTVYMKKD